LNIKSAIRAAVAQLLYAVGILQLWQAVVLRRRAVVLMYHRVLTSDEQRRAGSHPGIVVGHDTFARQMSLLRRRFVVLSVEEFAAHLEQKRPFPSSSCLITFDDGWRDNFVNALPVLEEERLPSVVFLPVNFIGTNRLFWREALTQLLVRASLVARDAAHRDRLRAPLSALGMERVLDIEDADPRPKVVEAVARRFDARRPADSEAIGALARALGIGIDDFADADGFMNWDQARSMSRHGVAFGGHGAEHRLLTDIPSTEAGIEIQASRNVVAENVGETVPTFSYPNGNWNEDIARQVKSSGYRLAFTTQPGFVRCDDDCFALRRVNVHEGSTPTPAMFLARVVGLL
jgi:peptidoglycan/xylan/chitin deacetylase (PgdA/CDA1 family)